MRIENLTTLIYILREKHSSDNKVNTDVLFIAKRSYGLNNGKYLGVGGHFEEGESPEDCVIREVLEESGIKLEELEDLSFRGLVSFINDSCDDEYMHVFTAKYKGDREVTPGNCDEGELIWVPIDKIYDLPIWEGDKEIFNQLFNNDKFFSMKLIYHGDELVNTVIYK